MAEEQYELYPQQLIADLKYDVEALKKKLLQPDTKMNELVLEIESLKDTLHDLQTIFTKALEETKENDAYATITLLKERLDAVVKQNETIAQGMVAISDKVEEFIQRNSGTARRTSVPAPVPIKPPLSQDFSSSPPKIEGDDFPPAPPTTADKKNFISSMFKR